MRFHLSWIALACASIATTSLAQEANASGRLASNVLPGFSFDSRYHEYSTRAAWRDAEVEVILSGETEAERVAALATAELLWLSQEYWSEAVRRRAVHDLLELKNSGWAEDGAETVLTEEQFTARMTVQSVAAYADGSFEFFFDDGGMFFGHTILVRGTLKAGVESAEIAG